MAWNFCLCLIKVILLCWIWKKNSIDFSNNLWKVMSTSPSSKNTNLCHPLWTCFTVSLFPSESSRIQRTWSLNDFFPFNFAGLLFTLFISTFSLNEILIDFPWIGVLNPKTAGWRGGGDELDSPHPHPSTLWFFGKCIF